jgi:hypothetical protein
MQLIESLNRTVKLALDDGTAGSVEEAEQLFHSFDVQLVVGRDVQHSQALQAALVTLLNAAPRTFLGEVTVTGELSFRLDIGWWRGEALRDVAGRFGVACTRSLHRRPSILIGDCAGTRIGHEFQLRLGLTSHGFVLSPDSLPAMSTSKNIAAAVAAAGAALNECFQFLYFRRPWAGQREIEFELPGGALPSRSSPSSMWVVGLGHVGQAFLWCTGLHATPGLPTPMLRLQDFDRVTASGLSTGLLTCSADVGHLKAEVAAREMRKTGARCAVALERADPGRPPPPDADLSIVAVDSFGFRRKLDGLGRLRIIEGGIGDGTRGFTQVQIHSLPGQRTAADIWCGADPAATRQISISAPAYQNLLRDTRDECGTTQLAGRAVATPFVGAFLGALMYCIAVGGSPDRDSLAFDVNNL